jgi:hypothetical protein
MARSRSEKRYVTLEDGRVIFIEGPGEGLGVAQQQGLTVTQSRFTPTESGDFRVDEQVVAAPVEMTGSGVFADGRELRAYWSSELPMKDYRDLGYAVEATWEPGERRNVARAAITSAYTYPGQNELLALLDENENGEIRDTFGFASVRRRTNRDNGYDELEFLATKQRGLGKAMMRMIMQRAYDSGRGVSWVSLPEAQGFYDAIGFAGFIPFPGRPFFYVVPANAVAEWVLGQKMDPALLEPESGVFVVPLEFPW